jgi:multidrug resistance efflux pump
MFTLIDSTTWYVVANYRESKLKNIRLGSPVDVLLMGHPDRKFHGVVEGIGTGHELKHGLHALRRERGPLSTRLFHAQ